MTSAVGSSAAISSGGMPHNLRYWSLTPVISPSLETTTIPSAVVSSVASSSETARRRPESVSSRWLPSRTATAMAGPPSTVTSEQVISSGSSLPSRRRPAAANGRRPARAAAAQPAEDPQEPAALVLGEQDVVPDAEQLFARIAKEPLGRRVHERDGSVRGQQQESIGALLEQAFFNPSSHGDTGPQSDGC